MSTRNYLKARELDLMKKDNSADKNNINIELDENTAQGSYSNLVIVNHSPTEFVLDFINVMPGSPKAKVRSRIILTPQHAKRFLKALDENLVKYESSFGEIQNLQRDVFPLNFGGSQGGSIISLICLIMLFWLMKMTTKLVSKKKF